MFFASAIECIRDLLGCSSLSLKKCNDYSNRRRCYFDQESVHAKFDFALRLCDPPDQTNLIFPVIHSFIYSFISFYSQSLLNSLTEKL